MKSLHRPDLFAWSTFDEPRNVDFSGHLWTRPEGNVLFDPMPLSAHDRAHLDALGGASWILISNADHARDAARLANELGARIGAPADERDRSELQELPDVAWIPPDSKHETGVRCITMRGSKSAGEFAFLLPGGEVLLTGDLVRGQRAGTLNLLPDPKLKDKAAAIASVARLAALPNVTSVLVGDGQSIFRDGRARLLELVESVS
jgi:hypothetical protein